MEKFTRWEDKSCGINPFVPHTRRPRGWLGGGVAFALSVAKLGLAVAALGLIAVVGAVEAATPGWPLRKALRMIIMRPLARLALLALGYWTFDETVLDPRRLRMGKLSKAGQESSARARASFGATVAAGDIIIINHTSLVDVLYAFWRFDACFALPALPAGKSVQVVGVVGALRRAVWAGSDATLAPYNAGGLLPSQAAERASAQAGAPLVVLAEGVRSNGKAVLKFVDAMGADAALREARVHVLGVDYQVELFSPAEPVAGAAWYVFWSCQQFRNRLSANLVPHEVRTAEVEVREGQDPASAPGERDLRDLLAASVGKRGVKCVDLGVEEYLGFMQYYRENAKVRKSR